MGSDIHWYSETKKDGKWVCDQADSRTMEDYDGEREYAVLDSFPGRGRDYWMFGLLAKNRTIWPWSFDEKGMPDDASDEVKEQSDGWGVDGHSHSYLTRAELKAKLEEIKLARPALLITPGGSEHMQGANHFADHRLPEVIGHLNAGVPDEDQRIVFWFDN